MKQPSWCGTITTTTFPRLPQTFKSRSAEFRQASKKVLLEHYRIDETHSNAYTAWKNMGSPQSPTPEQYAQLKAAGQLQLLTSPVWLDVDKGRATVETTLPRQAVSLLRLKW